MLGLGLAWPLASRLCNATGDCHSRPHYIFLILVYLIEAFAFAASMSTNILSIILPWSGEACLAGGCGVTVALVAVACKVIVTMGIVRLMTRREALMA